MGLGTKIKEVLHGDKEHTYHDSSKSPAHPSQNDVPRSHHNDTYGNSPLISASEPRTDRHAGRSSAEYTYGSKAGTAGTPESSTVGRHSHDVPGTTNTPQRTGILGSGSGALSHSTSNKLSKKDHKDPYWGDNDPVASGTRTATAIESGTGVHDRVGDEAHARDVNNGYKHDSIQRGNFTSTGTSGHDDQRYRRDDDVGNMRTSTTTTTGTTSNLTHRPLTSGIGGPYESGTDRRQMKLEEYDAPTSSSDRSHGLATAGASAAAGYGVSTLTGRHHDDSAGLNDPHVVNTANKPGTGVGTSMLDVDSYGTNRTSGPNFGLQSGRDVNAESHMPGSYPQEREGRGAGAVGGVGSNLPIHDQHHISSHTSTGPGSGFTGNRGAETAEGLSGPHSSRLTNTVDPRVDSDRDHRSNVTDYGHIGHGSNAPGSHMYDQGHGLNSGVRNNRDANSAGQGYNTTSVPGAGTYGVSHQKHDSGLGRTEQPISQGTSQYSQEASSLGSDHFGPGHQGAKVFHKCHNCGADNDISKHFRKDAVYRME